MLYAFFELFDAFDALLEFEALLMLDALLEFFELFDAFDEFVTKWYENGGETITQEVREAVR